MTTPTTPSTAAAALAPRDATPHRAVHIPVLDGLRGLAILLVIVFHFTVSDSNNGALRRSVLYLTGAGWVGVDLFFVLSGFLITTILYQAKESDGFFRNFYMRRVLRIFPLYYGVLLVAFGIAPLFHKVAVDNQWALWLYLTNFVPVNHSSFVHFWSLAVEEQFYMVWPAVVFVLNRRALMGVCGAMMLAALVARIVRVSTGSNAELTYYATYCRMDSLAVGALIALVALAPGGIAALARPAKWVGAIAGAFLVGMYVWNRGFFHPYMPYKPHVTHLDGGMVVQTVGYSLLGLFFGAVLIRAILASPDSLFGRIFNSLGLQFFGKYSYGIYVIHGLIHPLLHHHLPPAAMPKGGGMFFLALAGRIALGTAVSVAGALLTWHLYEKHFLKLKRFFEYRAKTLTEPVNDGIVPPSASAHVPLLVKAS